MSTLKNSFTEDTRLLWIWAYECIWCGRNQNLELHHILKRISNSPLNSALICRKCHDRGDIHDLKNRIFLLKTTYKFLEIQNYQLTDKDREFMVISVGELLGNKIYV
jgi:uncharacterized protein YlaI